MFHKPQVRSISKFFFTFILLAVASIGTVTAKPASSGDDDARYTKPVAQNLDAIRAQVRYPAALTEARLEGTVLLRVLVDANGQPQQFEFADQAHPLFRKAALNAAESLRFTPGKVQDQQVDTWVVIPFRFRLQ